MNTIRTRSTDWAACGLTVFVCIGWLAAAIVASKGFTPETPLFDRIFTYALEAGSTLGLVGTLAYLASRVASLTRLLARASLVVALALVGWMTHSWALTADGGVVNGYLGMGVPLVCIALAYLAGGLVQATKREED